MTKATKYCLICLGISLTYLFLLEQSLSAPHEDFYDILGIQRTATDDEIKRAYRKLSIQYHPDRIKSTNPEHKKAATDKFIKISQAYEILKDADKRKQYDMNGSDIFFDGSDTNSSISSIFFSISCTFLKKKKQTLEIMMIVHLIKNLISFLSNSKPQILILLNSSDNLSLEKKILRMKISSFSRKKIQILKTMTSKSFSKTYFSAKIRTTILNKQMIMRILKKMVHLPRHLKKAT